jgi:hypothetical protein
MLDNMRRLHPRGAANWGICVDAEGAMLGPDQVLVHRTSQGYRGIARDDAAVLQKCLLDADRDRDWLFQQCRRIAEALDKGEIALAQIYGLRIPIDDLDDRQLKRLAYSRFAKIDFNPDEPRIPKGDPHGGEWTNGGEGARGAGTPLSAPDLSSFSLNDDVPTDEGAGDAGQPASSNTPPMKWEIVPREDAAPGDAPPTDATDTDPSSAGTLGFDFPIAPMGGGPSGGVLPTEEAGPPEEGSADNPGSGSSESSSTETAGGERPPIEWNINIPDQEPAIQQQRNPILRAIATWLGRAAGILGVAFSTDPRVRMAFAAIEAVAWIAKYWPLIESYLDEPKTLGELQNAVDQPGYGYEIHHIVEAQPRSENPQRNSLRFADQINSRENLVRVPYWKHVEISSWYSRANDQFGDLSPREYLREKSWEEQYDVGLRALRRFGVLK